MTWQIIPLSRSLGGYRADWDVLSQRYYAGHPFSDSRFIEPLLRIFGTGLEHLCVHRSGDTIDGMVILAPTGRGVWRQFLPPQREVAITLIPDAALVNDLFSALPLGTWAIELINQDPEYAPRGLFSEVRNRVFLQHALTMNVSLAGDFDAYWNERPKKLAQNLRRYVRLTEKSWGSPKIVVLTQPEDIPAGVLRYGQLESAGWKGKQGTAIHAANEQGALYSEALLSFAEANQAKIVELWLGEHLAASRLIACNSNMAVMLKTTYDESLSQFAPGRLLLQKLLEHLFAEHKHTSVEFYTNATQDQLAWATGQRHISHVTFYRHPWLALAYRAYKRLKGAQPVQRSADTAIESHQVKVFERLSDLPKECAPLFSVAEAHSFDLGTDWFRLLAQSAIPANTKPFYYVLMQNTKIRCVLPLLVGTNPPSGFTTFYSSLYRPIMAANLQPAELAVLIRHVMAETHTATLRFDAMDPTDTSYATLMSALRLAGMQPYSFFGFGNWFLPVNGRNFAIYLAGLDSQTRNTLKRRRKKFINSGRGRLEIVSAAENMEPALQAWENVYRASWKKPEPFPDFIPGLVHLCARRGWLRLGLAFYDDKPIAAQIWIVNQGRAAIYKLAYDEAAAEHSAGTLLTAHLMQHVLDIDHVHEVDYLIGDDAYKKQWVSHRRERWGIIGHNPKTLRGLWGCCIQLLGKYWLHNKRNKNIKGDRKT